MLEWVKEWEIRGNGEKWGLIKGCGSVSATPVLRKTRNPYFLTIYPHSVELSDNFTLTAIPLEC